MTNKIRIRLDANSNFAIVEVVENNGSKHTKQLAVFNDENKSFRDNFSDAVVYCEKYIERNKKNNIKL